MNAERLLAHYERIAEAPEAIDRLRSFIRDLAMRGKLLPQDSKDEPAPELLKRIHRDRKHKRKFAQIDDDELGDSLPALPPTWAWTTADQVSADDENAITDGPFGSQLKTAHYIHTPGFRVIRLQNIGSGTFRAEHRSYIDQSRFEQLSKHHVAAGDLVVAGLVDPLVRCCEVPSGIGPALVKADCYRFAVHPKVSARFAIHFLNSSVAQAFAAVHHHGMTLTRIGLGNFRRLPFPVPPLAEQTRIATKIDELMVLCDRLEAARSGRESTRNRLAASSLARINAPDPETFQGDASFVLDALPALTTRPDQIKQLRQTILNLAVRGRLVPQDPNDEPAAAALTRRKIAVSSEGSFTLPQSWVWAAVGAVAEARLGKMLDKAKNKGTPRRYLRNINVRWFDFDLSDLLEMRFEDSELPEFTLRSGDVLICEGGEPGRAAVWDERESDIYFQKAIHRVRFSPLVDSEYFVKALRASAEDGRLAEYFTGTGIKHFTGKGLSGYVFPLPPLAEQERIVAKVNQLMALCDRLETNLTETATTRRRVLDALLAEALEPAEVREVETVA